MDKTQAGRRGRYGEELACAYLREHGFEILGRNYRTRYGELDIVARQGALTVFAEVKLRRSAGFAAAAESVGPKKQERLRKAALLWMARYGEPESARFDVFEIYAPAGGRPALRCIKNAF